MIAQIRNHHEAKVTRMTGKRKQWRGPFPTFVH